MKRNALIVVTAVAGCLLLWAWPSVAAEFKITKVYDGDTVKAEGKDTLIYVMLVGIDAPEIGTRSGAPSQPFGDEGRKVLSELVLEKVVEVKAYGRGPYPHDHILGEIHVDGMNVNLEMIRRGLAEVCRADLPKGLDLDSYLSAEEEARTFKRGMWSQGKHYESPAVWRERTRIKN